MQKKNIKISQNNYENLRKLGNFLLLNLVQVGDLSPNEILTFIGKKIVYSNSHGISRSALKLWIEVKDLCFEAEARTLCFLLFFHFWRRKFGEFHCLFFFFFEL